MNAIVFSGPTLSADSARVVLEAIYLPPAEQGDVYRACLNRPVAIGIIDGVFDQVPSVWHKEILWAMSHGIHVYGSASMGALRAAELAAFGMTGVGKIFRAYESGVLEDDDEVAVIHGKQEENFRVLSDAMVNIRQTLLRAEADGVMSITVASALEHIAKNLMYPDRSYGRVLEIAKESGLPSSQLDAFHSWLPEGKIDQKRDDALEMLRVMRADLQNGLAPKSVNYKFEHSVVWNALVNSAGVLHTEEQCTGNVSIDEILSEIWADPELCLQAYQYATIRHLVRQSAQMSNATVLPEKVAAVEKAFRTDRGIAEECALQAWLQQHHTNPEEFADLILHESLLHESSLAAAPFPHRWMIDWLRISGQFDETLAAALRKKQLYVEGAEESADPQNADLATETLLEWYVERLAPDAPGRSSTRQALPYLRNDWEAFLASLVKRRRSQRGELHKAHPA